MVHIHYQIRVDVKMAFEQHYIRITTEHSLDEKYCNRDDYQLRLSVINVRLDDSTLFEIIALMIKYSRLS